MPKKHSATIAPGHQVTKFFVHDVAAQVGVPAEGELIADHRSQDLFETIGWHIERVIDETRFRTFERS
jgi:hypothetical protein